MINEERVECTKGIFTFGVNAIKAAVYINSGAIIALLTFIGRIIESDNSKSIEIMAFSLLIFAIGIVLGCLTFGGSYIAQCYYMSDEFDIWVKGHTYRMLVIIFLLFSYTAFLVGSFYAYGAFKFIK